MFDYIKFKDTCPICFGELNNFQSKSGDCLLEVLDFTSVNNFYDICENCGTWVEYTLKTDVASTTRNINDYDKKVTIRDEWRNKQD